MRREKAQNDNLMKEKSKIEEEKLEMASEI